MRQSHPLSRAWVGVRACVAGVGGDDLPHRRPKAEAGNPNAARAGGGGRGWSPERVHRYTRPALTSQLPKGPFPVSRLGKEGRPRHQLRRLGGSCETSSETRIVGSVPSFAHWLAVEDQKDRGDQNEYGLINRPRNRQEAQSSNPAKRLGNATVAGQEPRGSDGSDDECACGSHAVSLGGRGSRSD
jgi:hypothetical protein